MKTVEAGKEQVGIGIPVVGYFDRDLTVVVCSSCRRGGIPITSHDQGICRTCAKANDFLSCPFLVDLINVVSRDRKPRRGNLELLIH